MTITSFADLLDAARAQPQPQRLLFVFTVAELPPDSTPEQRRQFEAGRGGALVPLMCVDKTPGEISSFADLVAESREMQGEWSVAFVAALDGRHGRAPTSKEAEAPLQRMIESIKAGSLANFMAFDREGQTLLLG